MIRLLHTADVHLGARFLSLGDKGAAQRQQIKAAFRKLVFLAIAERVDMVLTAGDLFDSNQQPQANVDLVVEQFGLLAAADIHVCLIPGTHDCFDSGSIYRKFDFPGKCPNLTLFLDQGWNHREFPALGLTVYARLNLSNRSYNSPLEGLTPSTSPAASPRTTTCSPPTRFRAAGCTTSPWGTGTRPTPALRKECPPGSPARRRSSPPTRSSRAPCSW